MSLNISHLCINSFFHYWSIKSCRLAPTFHHGEWGFSPGTPRKGDECQRAHAPLPHLCKVKCRQTAFSFPHLHKTPHSLFSSGLSGALGCWHYTLIFLWEAVCITEPGTISPTAPWVTPRGRGWSCRTGLTQPRGLCFQSWTCTDIRAGSNCCPGLRGMKDESSSFGVYFKSCLQWSLLKAERRKRMTRLPGAIAAQLLPPS